MWGLHRAAVATCHVALGIDGKVSGGTCLCQVALSIGGKVLGGTLMYQVALIIGGIMSDCTWY